MSKNPLRRAALAASFALLPAFAHADIITDWNQQLLEAVRATRTNPPAASRQMAILHTAQFDAVTGILGGYERYHATGNPLSPASPEAAAAAAGHKVLSALYPARQASFDTLYAAQLAAIADDGETNGVDWGHGVADQILALRANDGAATAAMAYNPPVGATWWTNTPPAFAPALLPGWPKVTPWALERGNQLRSPGQPVSPTDPAYLASWVEVYLLGGATSTLRTADQTEIALFWNDGAGTMTPPGHWMTIAQGFAADKNLSLQDSARLFALLGISLADAAIVAWDNKYAFHNWRPVTGIHLADIDGNAATFVDTTWSSLITTPPFPSYTSGHSTFSGAGSQVLALFNGSDDYAFSVGSDGLPGVTRDFDTFTEAAAEGGQSRIYGGIHWQYDNTDGLAGGRALGHYVYENYLRPLGQNTTCADGPYTLCLLNRFRVEVGFRTATGATNGRGTALPNEGYDGRFFFFSPDNAEVMVKVLDACTLNDKFWVFAAGATNVEYTLKVTDTVSRATRVYFNPLNHTAKAVNDIDAFATCP